ncbi:hypothetical protein PCCS19_25240 [Paenibacillus sp. CCS19]|uniref:hypothetical protein n=1 Tax=Paenibacillus sp. CCS19 TaxID=3158387 RepID=UPI002562A606|nr:hypothetical protein [Paenibacillus cellulosilyticus]GMK39470.1 hypothetical protein PCCS19_25240 [Paenibacillus cellulosilyticus]
MNKKFASLLVGLLVVLCLGISITNAQSPDTSIEEKTSLSVNEFRQAPLESAKYIFNDYFTEIMKTGDRDGEPLLGFTINNIDISSPDRIKASVILDYGNDFGPLPAIEYSIVQVLDRYQVQKQICSVDMDVRSPNYKTVKCTPDFVVDKHSITAKF